MRLFVAVSLALAAAWAIFLASPYWAMWDLARAIEARSAERLAERINFRAVRQSLAKQLVTDGLQSKPLATALAGPDAKLAAGTVAAAADPLLEQIVTAEGLLALLPDRRGAKPRPAAASADAEAPIEVVADLLPSSRWRGFRNVYFTWPPDRPPDESVRLQVRLSRLSWRLVSIELPPATRARLLADLIRLLGDAQRR